MSVGDIKRFSLIAVLIIAGLCIQAQAKEDKVDFLIDKLKNGSTIKVRVQAAVLLGKSGSMKAILPLIEALSDENYLMRAGAAFALGNLGDAVAVRPLVNHLLNDTPFVKRQCVAALKKLVNDSSYTILKDALKKTNDETILLNLIDIIRTSKSFMIHKLLIGLLVNQSTKIQKHAIAAIDSLGTKEATQLYSNCIFSDNTELVYQCLKKLKEFPNKKIIDKLAEFIIDPVIIDKIKIASRAVLKESKSFIDTRKYAAIARGEGNFSKEERSKAVTILAYADNPEAFSAIIDTINDKDPFVQGYAAMALAEAGDPRGIDILKMLIKKTRNKRVLQVAKNSLKKLQAIKVLSK